MNIQVKISFYVLILFSLFSCKKENAEVKFKNSRLIDLDGATLLPGFIDPHTNWYGFKYDGLSREL